MTKTQSLAFIRTTLSRAMGGMQAVTDFAPNGNAAAAIAEECFRAIQLLDQLDTPNEPNCKDVGDAVECALRVEITSDTIAKVIAARDKVVALILDSPADGDFMVTIHEPSGDQADLKPGAIEYVPAPQYRQVGLKRRSPLGDRAEFAWWEDLPEGVALYVRVALPLEQIIGTIGKAAPTLSVQFAEARRCNCLYAPNGDFVGFGACPIHSEEYPLG